MYVNDAKCSLCITVCNVNIVILQIPSLMVAVQQCCRRCAPCQRRNGVTPQEEEDQEIMVEMEGGTPPVDTTRRVLTPVTPFREEEHEAN